MTITKKGLTNIVKECWWIIPPIILGAYGCVEFSLGAYKASAYEAIKTGTNQGLLEMVIGLSAVGAAGISTTVLYTLSEHLKR